MYCSKCAQEVEARGWRCNNCRSYTAAFKRNALSIVILGISGFALYWTYQVFRIWFNLLAAYGREADVWMRTAGAFTSNVMKFGLWIVLVYVCAAILLRKKISFFASGRPTIWIAGLFALLTLATTLAGGIEGAIIGIDGWNIAREKNYALNELYARDAMRNVIAAESAYQASHKNQYACDLSTLELNVSQRLAAEHGYDLFLMCAGEPATSYHAFARPISENVTGRLAYCSDEHSILDSVPSYRVTWGPASKDANTCLKEGQTAKE